MANKLDAEARMTIKSLAERGHTNRAIARLLGMRTRCAITDVARRQMPLTVAAGSRIWPNGLRRRSLTGWNRWTAAGR